MSVQLTAPQTRVAAGRLPYVVAALSALYAVLGAYWAFGGSGYPFGPVPPDRDKLDLLSLVPREPGATLVAVLGAFGVPAALATRRPGWSEAAYRPLLATAAVQAVVFGLLCADMSILIVTGYALVLLGVPAFLLMLILGAIRTPGTRILLAAVAALLAALVFGTGVINGPAFGELADGLAGVPDKVGFRPLLVLGAFLLGTGWALLGVRSFRLARDRCVRCGRPGAAWTRPEPARRWGFWATIVAALCPMPYALLRFTWLLPNPVGFGAEELDAQPGIKMFGLGLGTVAFCAGLVTLGLIRPWGEVCTTPPGGALGAAAGRAAGAGEGRGHPRYGGRPAAARRQPVAVHDVRCRRLVAAPDPAVPAVGYLARHGHRRLLLPPPRPLRVLRRSVRRRGPRGRGPRGPSLSCVVPVRCPGRPTSDGPTPRRSPAPAAGSPSRCR
jgi:hypothetical protein